jgi:hypothetical protein
MFLRVLVSFLIEVVKKKFDLICLFFFPNPPWVRHMTADLKIVDVSQKFHTADTALPRSQNRQEPAVANTSHKMFALPAN